MSKLIYVLLVAALLFTLGSDASAQTQSATGTIGTIHTNAQNECTGYEVITGAGTVVITVSEPTQSLAETLVAHKAAGGSITAKYTVQPDGQNTINVHQGISYHMYIPSSSDLDVPTPSGSRSLQIAA